MMLVVGVEALCFNIDGENITNRKLHCWGINGEKEFPVVTAFLPRLCVMGTEGPGWARLAPKPEFESISGSQRLKRLGFWGAGP
jgi:hypothetical protein